MIFSIQGGAMKQRTVRIDIEPPLSQIKSRIDEIYSVIEKHAFVEPMLSDGTRRALLADSILNIERNGQKNFPNLSVTNVRPEYVGKMARQVPSSILRGEARIAVALEQEAKNRLERRKLLHRSCTGDPVRNNKTECRVPRQVEGKLVKKTSLTMDQPQGEKSPCEREARAREEITPPILPRSNQSNRSSCRFDPLSDRVPRSEVKVPVERTICEERCPQRVQESPCNPETQTRGEVIHLSPLDQLVYETNELLGSEHLDYDFVHDDIISEIERDIEQLT